MQCTSLTFPPFRWASVHVCESFLLFGGLFDCCPRSILLCSNGNRFCNTLFPIPMQCRMHVRVVGMQAQFAVKRTRGGTHKGEGRSGISANCLILFYFIIFFTSDVVQDANPISLRIE